MVVKEALANGRLTSLGAVPELDEAARDLASTPDAVALAAVLARPWADVVLSGAATQEQLRGNLAAMAMELGADRLARLDVLAEDPSDYWETRSALPWN